MLYNLNILFDPRNWEKKKKKTKPKYRQKTQFKLKLLQQLMI